MENIEDVYDDAEVTFKNTQMKYFVEILVYLMTRIKGRGCFLVESHAPFALLLLS